MLKGPLAVAHRLGAGLLQELKGLRVEVHPQVRKDRLVVELQQEQVHPVVLGHLVTLGHQVVLGLLLVQERRVDYQLVPRLQAVRLLSPSYPKNSQLPSQLPDIEGMNLN